MAWPSAVDRERSGWMVFTVQGMRNHLIFATSKAGGITTAFMMRMLGSVARDVQTAWVVHPGVHVRTSQKSRTMSTTELMSKVTWRVMITSMQRVVSSTMRTQAGWKMQMRVWQIVAAMDAVVSSSSRMANGAR